MTFYKLQTLSDIISRKLSIISRRLWKIKVTPRSVSSILHSLWSVSQSLRLDAKDDVYLREYSLTAMTKINFHFGAVEISNM